MVTEQQLEARKILADALCSGEYKQGSGRLTTVHHDGTTSHCCLGVACEVYEKLGLGTFVKEDSHVDDVSMRAYSGEKFFAPLCIRNWLGITMEGRFSEGVTMNGEDAEPWAADAHDSVASLNDTGCPFNIIADVFRSKGFKEDYVAA
jgi:hypothetical protein